jgi:hypothetical protein
MIGDNLAYATPEKRTVGTEQATRAATPPYRLVRDHTGLMKLPQVRSTPDRIGTASTVTEPVF